MFNMTKGGRINYSYLADVDAGDMTRRNIVAWAEAGSLLDIEFFNNPGVALDVKTSFISYILAWDSIKDAEFVTAGERQEVDNYFETLAVKLNYSEGQELGYDGPTGIDVFNHSSQQSVALMAYGIYAENDEFFHQGIRKFFAVLDGLIREDGSHFFESQRGGAALGYSINATNLLIRMAEMAFYQGYNLYDVEIEGKTLHTILEFHISVLEDNELIHEYTKYQNPLTCGPIQCENWNNQTYVDGFSYAADGSFFAFADFEIYRRRFPDSPLNQRFDAVIPVETHTPIEEGPLSQTCEFRSTE